VVGSVDGSPAVAGQTFFGYEHPMAHMAVENGRVHGAHLFNRNLWPGEELRHSAVIGVYPAGQQRHGFWYYPEQERAHPYRTFLHHNNGEDMGAKYWAKVYGYDGIVKDPDAAA